MQNWATSPDPIKIGGNVMRFISKHAALMLYAGDVPVRFIGGAFSTEDAVIIKAIKSCDDYGKTVFEDNPEVNPVKKNPIPESVEKPIVPAKKVVETKVETKKESKKKR